MNFVKKTFLMLCLVLLWACSDDSSSASDSANETALKKVKVAMILPRDEENAMRYDRLTEWFDQNLAKTRQVMSSIIDTAFAFEYEWYDVTTIDLDSITKALAKREDILAIVGPRKSVDVDVAVKNCSRTGKTLIVPTASSAEVVRKAAVKKWFWALSETDITQSELLIALAQSHGAKKVSLLAADNILGQTFIDWFPFQAEELGVNIGKIHAYTDADLATTAAEAMKDGSDFVIVAPGSEKDVETILKEHEKSKKKPQLRFTDVAFTPAVLKYKGAEGIEGTSMYADPESGFQIAYEVMFDDVPVNGDPQIYDALMILAFAEMDILAGNSQSLDEAMAKVTAADSGSTEVLAWDYEGMSRVIAAIASGTYYNIRGASGKLNFDTENGSVVTQSIYCHWMIYDGKFLPLEYISSTGSNRTSATLASWNWNNSKIQSFEKEGKFTYPKHKSNYALLVAASNTWENFRHQADVLNVYQILKYLGYDDDHIVLIMADDLAQDPSNPYPGEVHRYDGQNLYVDVDIDYKLKDLESGDITKILMGQKSSKLKHVIDADSNTNVLVFWSGHGSPGEFVWKEDSEFTYDQMEETLKELHEGAKYRKMLWLVEACFSESVCKAAENNKIPGVLCMTAANENETSKADVYNHDYGVYLTNRFTEILTGLLQNVVANKKDGETPDMPFSDIYYYLFKYTLGSHVTVLNAKNFDNLYTAGIREFIVPMK